jgi:uncharacterized membrane protein (UPF0127 family)
MTPNATLHTASNAAGHPLCVRTARSFWSRFRGLMFAGPLPTEPLHGLLITRCPSVHGFFMRYPIDVVYLSRRFEGARTVTHTATLKPWGISFGRKGSADALELPAGSIEGLGIRCGDQLRDEA